MLYYLYSLNKHCCHVIRHICWPFTLFWGPPLSQYITVSGCSKCGLNHAVHLCKGLCKYDHVSNLELISIWALVQHCRLSAMHNTSSFSVCNWNHLLYLVSIMHLYGTRPSALFVRPLCCHLPYTQIFFGIKLYYVPKDMWLSQEFPSTLFS